MCFGAIDIVRFLKKGAKGTGVVNFTLYLSICSMTGSFPFTIIESLALVSPKPPKIIVLNVK